MIFEVVLKMIEKLFCKKQVFVTFLIILSIEMGDCSNILCVAPFPAISHYQMMEPLILGLAARGHHVTVLSHFPKQTKIENLTDIDLRETFPPYELEFISWGLMEDMQDLFAMGQKQCRMFAESEKVQNFLQIPQKFDLIFIEAFNSECYLGLVAKFNAPFILFSAMALPVWKSDWIYNPTAPNYLPDNLCRLSLKMNFFERLQNVGCHLFFRFLNWYYNAEFSLKIIQELFHVNIDSLESIKSKVSFIFVNSFYGITGVRPFLPNVLEVGGIHIKPLKPLPRDLELFINGSVDGVIVISMGSIVKSHTLNSGFRKEILSVISKLKERVVWKWEANLPNKSSNLLTVPWFPQSDVLGHPKVKLFISHGGIHSLFEAIHHGIPIIGIPLFGDQIGNLKALEAKGIAIVIDFFNISEKNLLNAINRMLGNDSYQINAKKLSSIYHDQPQTPLNKAIFWTEYVIRHEGAPHFQSGALKLSWAQYALIDVLLVFFSICILLIVVFQFSLNFLRTI